MAPKQHYIPDITILMPTYKRLADFKRTLHYMAERFDLTRMPLLVLDGSPADIAAQNRAVCESLNVRHIDYGPDFPQFERWLDGIRQAETPFVCFVPDDDFLGPTALGNCVSFLSANPDYAAACGKVRSTMITSGKSQLLYFMYPWLQSVTSENPLERVVEFYYNYSDMTYAVHRRDLLEMIMAEIVEQVDPNYFVFMEYYENAILPLYGKIKQVNNLYMCRKRDPVQPPRRKGEYRQPDNATHEKLNSDHMMYTHAFLNQFNGLKRALIRHAYNVNILQPGVADCLDAGFEFEGYLERQVEEIIEHAFSAYMSRVFLLPRRQRFLGLRKSRRPWPVYNPFPTKSPPAIVIEMMKDLWSHVADRAAYWQQAITDKYFNMRPLIHLWMRREEDTRAVADFIGRWRDDAPAAKPVSEMRLIEREKIEV